MRREEKEGNGILWSRGLRQGSGRTRGRDEVKRKRDVKEEVKG